MPGDANWSTRLDSNLKIQADMLEAQTDRLNGCQGRNARDILRDMEQVIAEAIVISGKRGIL